MSAPTHADPTLNIMLCGIAVLLAIGIVGIFTARTRRGPALMYGVSLIVSVILTATALRFLLDGADAQVQAKVLPIGLPWIGAHFDLDLLAAMFLLVANLGGASASLYGLGYGAHESDPTRVVPVFPVFLAAMNLVVIAGDAFSFLISWEFMSLSSWALVMAHHEEADNRRAGYIYLVMATFGTLALLLAFGLFAGPDGGYAFAEMRLLDHADVRSGFIFGLVLIGCGSKAGLVPLHAWLPLAHPAAPSHVSALMSGVMTKIAIYGFIRIVFDLLGPPQTWWSVVVLSIGGITAVLGILHAMLEDDLKRLLAYSTVENIGIIFIGLGLALAFESGGIPWAAALAFVAALFHVLNHSLFKSLLFYGAGAVHAATQQRDMEHLGGLIHRMPITALAFLIGAMAIAALPPLNGFVSEWLTFQAILVSPQLSAWGLKFLIPAVGAMLALSAALAAACFVKAFGLTFLGRPRSSAAQIAQEPRRTSRGAMLLMVVLCIAAGIVPGYVIDAISPVTDAFVGGHMPIQADQSWLTIVPIDATRSSYNGFYVFLFSALSASLAAYVIHRLASREVRRAPPWDCGYPDSSPALQYSASSFAQPIRRVFGTLLFQARETVVMREPGDVGAAHFHVVVRDLIWEGLYQPIERYVNFVAERANRMQFWTIRQYLGLVFIALVSLLSLLAFWQ
ncbi:MAG: hydrogenase 4 subunit B [Proteobacteria bacterium]|nr:hydrogenase 4 subunit B [Pseudomonadota bacterium]